MIHATCRPPDLCRVHAPPRPCVSGHTCQLAGTPVRNVASTHPRGVSLDTAERNLRWTPRVVPRLERTVDTTSNSVCARALRRRAHHAYSITTMQTPRTRKRTSTERSSTSRRRVPPQSESHPHPERRCAAPLPQPTSFATGAHLRDAPYPNSPVSPSPLVPRQL